MHYKHITACPGQQLLINLKSFKIAYSFRQFIFIAHTGPYISIDHISVFHCFFRIICKFNICFTLYSCTLNGLQIYFKPFRACNKKIKSQNTCCINPGIDNIISVSNPGYFYVFISTLMFDNSHDIT